MADIIVLEHRVGSLESDVKDINKDIERLDCESGEQSDRILRTENWRDGNGARGAEARLQGVEHDMAVLKECLGDTKTDAAIERIAAATANSIVKNARTRDRTMVEKVKAVSSLLSPILAALAVVLAAVLGSI